MSPLTAPSQPVASGSGHKGKNDSTHTVIAKGQNFSNPVREQIRWRKYSHSLMKRLSRVYLKIRRDANLLKSFATVGSLYNAKGESQVLGKGICRHQQEKLGRRTCQGKTQAWRTWTWSLKAVSEGDSQPWHQLMCFLQEVTNSTYPITANSPATEHSSWSWKVNFKCSLCLVSRRVLNMAVGAGQGLSHWSFL